ncbi:hypothetical protein GGR01_002276 [Acetobacter oeni]|nr:hypothetical protein [Acetobacter oeni]
MNLSQQDWEFSCGGRLVPQLLRNVSPWFRGFLQWNATDRANIISTYIVFRRFSGRLSGVQTFVQAVSGALWESTQMGVQTLEEELFP